MITIPTTIAYIWIWNLLSVNGDMARLAWMYFGMIGKFSWLETKPLISQNIELVQVWGAQHAMHMISRITYQARLDKRFMNFVTLQPLVVDKAFMPYIKAMYVPFHLLYGSLICYHRLQGDRPKCWGLLVEVSRTKKHICIITVGLWTCFFQ